MDCICNNTMSEDRTMRLFEHEIYDYANGRFNYNRHKSQNDTIDRYLDEIKSAGTPEQWDLVSLMFTYILNNGDFLNSQPRFRSTTLRKVREILSDERTPIKLHFILRKVEHQIIEQNIMLQHFHEQFAKKC
jgi:hypothetical protein